MKLPNLKNAGIISIDCETRDQSIAAKMGSGARRPGNYVLGVSIAVPGTGVLPDNTRAWYCPLAHPESENIDPVKFFSWLNQYKEKTFLGANILYDLDYFQYQGFVPTGKIYDVQFAEPLLNENLKKYNLDSLYERHLGIHKAESNIQNICDTNKWKGKLQEHLYKMKSEDVAEYAIGDVKPLLQLFNKQKELLEKDDILHVFEMECRLIPILLMMRKNGVRIDEEKLNEQEKKYAEKIKVLQNELDAFCGMEVNVNASTDLQKAFSKFGYSYPFTDKGNPSFVGKFLYNHGSELSAKIISLRQTIKMHNTYFVGLQKHIINGRVHCEFHPLRSDNYGAVSGRFSASNPPLQQMPKKDKEFKKAIRGIFLPEEGEDWVKLDEKQEEVVLFYHYARGAGAQTLRDAYINNDDSDVYIVMAQIGTGKKDIPDDLRSVWKGTTLGTIYGMATEKLGRQLNIITEVSPEEIKIKRELFFKIRKIKEINRAKYTDKYYPVKLYEIFWHNIYNKYDRSSPREQLQDIPKKYYKFVDQYEQAHKVLHAMHGKIPCLKETSKQCIDVAEKRGYVKTIYGRKLHLAKDELYKALNRVIQGSGGDVMKIAMIAGHDAGVFEVLRLLLTVHDELDVSVPRTKEGNEAVLELKHIMETSINDALAKIGKKPLRVPLRCDIEIGETWGTVAKKCLTGI